MDKHIPTMNEKLTQGRHPTYQVTPQESVFLHMYDTLWLSFWLHQNIWSIQYVCIHSRLTSYFDLLCSCSQDFLDWLSYCLNRKTWHTQILEYLQENNPYLRNYSTLKSQRINCPNITGSPAILHQTTSFTCDVHLRHGWSWLSTAYYPFFTPYESLVLYHFTPPLSHPFT